MPFQEPLLINHAELAVARRELGPALLRIMGYFRQDGAVSLGAIEGAMTARNAAAMVLPAHTLKGDARQLGADRVAHFAQQVEMTARNCVEQRSPLPDDLVTDVSLLRLCFHETVAALEQELALSPEPQRATSPQRPVFGRRATR